MAGNDIVQSQGTLAIRQGQTRWSDTQAASLVHIGIDQAPAADQSVFLHYCQRTGLDPWTKQIYMIKRRQDGKDKWTIQTGIDGFRLIAQRTGKYRGRVSVEWCGPDGEWRDVWLGGKDKPPTAARVIVRRSDYDQPFSAVALYDEFVGKTYQGDPNHMWATMPANQTAKCAEAAALRGAFPNDLAGMYTDDEMAQADNPQPGPSMPNVVDMPGPETAPQWQQMITERETVADTDPSAALDALNALFSQARGMIPKDGNTLNLILAARDRVKARVNNAPAAPAEPTPPKPTGPKMATTKQKGSIATAISRAGITGRDARLLVAARLAGLGNVLLSFDDLTAAQAGAVLDQIAEWTKESAERANAGINALCPDEGDPVWAEIDAARAAAEPAADTAAADTDPPAGAAE